MMIKHSNGHYYSHDETYIYVHSSRKKILISAIAEIYNAGCGYNLPIFRYYRDCIRREAPELWSRDNTTITMADIHNYQEE